LSESVVIVPTFNYFFGPTKPSAQISIQPSSGFEPDQDAVCFGNSLVGETTEAKCMRNGLEIPCTGYHQAGDIATLRCKTGYINPNNHLTQSDLQCLTSGRWSSPIYECVANCGRITKKAKV
jgi:Sushi repeat (SCR repeat)